MRAGSVLLVMTEATSVSHVQYLGAQFFLYCAASGKPLGMVIGAQRVQDVDAVTGKVTTCGGADGVTNAVWSMMQGAGLCGDALQRCGFILVDSCAVNVG